MLPEAVSFPVVRFERFFWNQGYDAKKHTSSYQLTISHDIPWTCLMSSNIWCQVRTKTYIDTDFLTTCVIEDQRKQAWEILSRYNLSILTFNWFLTFFGKGYKMFFIAQYSFPFHILIYRLRIVHRIHNLGYIIHKEPSVIH